MDKASTQNLSKVNVENFSSQLNAIRSKHSLSFEREKPLNATLAQVDEIKQVLSIVTKELPESNAKGAMLKFLESETNYYQQVSRLGQERVARARELSSTIIGPSGERIIPYAPLPFSEMQLVGWDKEGEEVYYNTDDGYYYKRDAEGSNSFTRFDGNYMDDTGYLHYAERDAENCTFWQWLYRFFGFADRNLTFPDVLVNHWDSVNGNKLRPDNPWFRLP
ncbi:MAG: hypothetical protein ACFCUE_15095 [Candidatus Bathyarchaeia archaeon]|jgi:hypothetical protein